MGFLSGIGSAISGSLGGIAGAIGGVASTILGNNSAKHEAEKNRQFQEQMSNTAISRRMQDLRNSGLNPLLAVENASAGASTPSGSQAQLQHFSPELISVLSTAKLQKQQGKSAEAGAKLQEQQTVNEKKQGNIIDAQGKIIEAQARKTNAEATSIENSNTLFAYEEARKKLENSLVANKINTEKLQQDVLRANSLKTQTEIVKNRLDAKGIELDNEQAQIVVELLKREKESWGSSTTAKNIDYGLEKVGQLIDLIPIPFVEKTTKTYKNGSMTTTTNGVRRGGR